MAAESEEKIDENNDETDHDEYNIFVIRHGERIDYVDKDWINKVNHDRYRDPYLAEKGIKQSKETAIKLLGIFKNKQLSDDNLIIISSPYIRCVQTASLFAKDLNYKSLIKIEPGICEVLKEYPPHFLDNNDINKDDLCSNMIDIDNKTYNGPFMNKKDFKKTESEGQSIKRSKRITKQIIDSYFKDKNKAKDMILLGHGASCYGMIEYLNNDYGDYIGLSCISHFKLKYNDNNNEYSIKTVCIGDSSHLSNQDNLRAF